MNENNRRKGNKLLIRSVIILFMVYVIGFLTIAYLSSLYDFYGGISYIFIVPAFIGASLKLWVNAFQCLLDKKQNKLWYLTMFICPLINLKMFAFPFIGVIVILLLKDKSKQENK